MIFHVLTLVFVISKILGYIAWPWWVVFSPSIIILVIALVTMCIAGAITLWVFRQ